MWEAKTIIHNGAALPFGEARIHFVGQSEDPLRI